MSYYSQWKDENRNMKFGDTIVQQIFIPPIQSFSQKIIFGVRINEIINEVNRKGFSYETLNGHVEKGISTFTIEELENKIFFKIHTFSKPGHLISRIAGPIFSIPYQTYCTKKALKYVSKQYRKTIVSTPHRSPPEFYKEFCQQSFLYKSLEYGIKN